MEEVTEEDVFNNNIFYSRCCLICGLFLKKRNVTKKEIAMELQDSISAKNFYNLINFLESKGFLIIDKSRKPYIYTIDGSELGWYLRNGKQWKINADYPLKASEVGFFRKFYYG